MGGRIAQWIELSLRTQRLRLRIPALSSHYCLVCDQYRDRTHLVHQGISQMQCSEGLSESQQQKSITLSY